VEAAHVVVCLSVGVFLLSIWFINRTSYKPYNYYPSLVKPMVCITMTESLRAGGKMVRLKIRELAEAKGFSQRKLSLKSGVDLRTVQRIFRDPLRVVTTETLDKFAKTLGVDASMLIESVPDPDE